MPICDPPSRCVLVPINLGEKYFDPEAEEIFHQNRAAVRRLLIIRHGEQEFHLDSCRLLFCLGFQDGELAGIAALIEVCTPSKIYGLIEDFIFDNDMDISLTPSQNLGKEMIRDLLFWAKESRMEHLQLTCQTKRQVQQEILLASGFVAVATNYNEGTNLYRYDLRESP